MSGFKPLFTLIATHEYFGEETVHCVDFLPDGPSSALLRNASLALQRFPGGIRVHYDEDRLAELRMRAADTDAPLRMVFRLSASDPAFANYTDATSMSTDSVNYFASERAHSAESGTTGMIPGATRLFWSEAASITDATFEALAELEFLRRATKENRLTPEDGVRLEELSRDEALADFRSFLTPRDRITRPIAIVAISIDPPGDDESASAVTPEYCVRFRALRTIWKYYLLGALAEPSANIEVPAGFQPSEVEREPLPEGGSALTFRSTEPIPLRARASRTVQLKDKGGAILMNRLPVAAPDGRGLRLDRTGPIVSNIYVNS